MHAPTLDARHRECADYLNLTLWTFQGWVALFFIAAAYAKLTQPMGDLAEMFSWTAAVGEQTVRGVGLAELGLAIALLVPLALRKAGRPFVVGSAAALLVLQGTMLGVHLIGGEFWPVAANLVLMGLTGSILWFRARCGV